MQAEVAADPDWGIGLTLAAKNLPFKALYKETIIRNPKKVGYLGSK